MKRLLLFVALIAISLNASAQRKIDSLNQYHRSSLYTVLIKHSQSPYGESIDSAFMAMPMPDKFNDHNLYNRSFESSAKKAKTKANSKKKDEVNTADIEEFFVRNAVAKALISKWFNRDSSTGICDMELISERGYYDASQLDIRVAEQSFRGKAQLADMGDKLLGNTFVLVNDITFADKGERTKKAAGWISAIGQIGSALLGVDVSAGTDLIAHSVDQFDGFRVNITSYLYRLVWDEDMLWNFYSQYYADESYSEADRLAARDRFNAIQGSDPMFRLEPVGKTTTTAENVSSKYFAKQSKSEQMLKVCTRAIDKSIVQLQREYEEFKVNVPIYRINDDKTVEVQIGLKEGVNKDGLYHVLMPVEDELGRITYNKIGELKPIEGKIWDNRFGALEDAEALAADKGAKADEDAEGGNAYLSATTFKIISGADRITPGCLVREKKIDKLKPNNK